ncbi:hypothetical protein [Rhodovulum sp. PH10]|uniref:hypothetical protein n=1 Tax=Rhodovulum sp. PH10 TaxID=1187851 RepID=UPI0012F784C3|nr:hypothetical protein [Rhodovulum sp. PH10]
MVRQLVGGRLGSSPPSRGLRVARARPGRSPRCYCERRLADAPAEAVAAGDDMAKHDEVEQRVARLHEWLARMLPADEPPAVAGPGEPEAPSVDPIHVAVSRHREWRRERGDVRQHLAGMSDEAIAAALAERDATEAWAVLDTAPKTPAGLAALARLAIAAEAESGFEPEWTEALLSRIAAAAEAMQVGR